MLNRQAMKSISLTDAPARSSFRDAVRHLGSKLLPHDTASTTCPPAQLVSGGGPVIIVASLMRSGTHLLLDTLFNNFPGLRRAPLFLDLDAYERKGLPVAPLTSVKGMIVKTHYPETPLAASYAEALQTLASRAIVYIPRRSSEEVRRSLAKWGFQFSQDQFAELENQFQSFWSRFSPTSVEFTSLLNPSGVQTVLTQIARQSGLTLGRPGKPVMPAKSRLGVYMDKALTRIAGSRAPRINTTIGYRLPPRQRT